jgi:sulfite exporter TauE/SafE
MLRGMTVMALFGLGTLPVLALLGCGSSLLGLAWRKRIFQAAAVCVVLTGLLTVGRGVAFLGGPTNDPLPGCPLCSGDEAGPRCEVPTADPHPPVTLLP